MIKRNKFQLLFELSSIHIRKRIFREFIGGFMDKKNIEISSYGINVDTKSVEEVILQLKDNNNEY